MLSMKRGLGVVALVFATMISVGCRREASVQPGSTSTPAVQAQAPRELKTVSIATSTNVWCALPLIAKERGFFEENGLDVKINIQDGGRYCMDALLGGSVDFANVVEVNVAYLGYTGNEDVRVVANVVDSTSMAIVGWKTSGINTPKDLENKRFGFTPGTQGEIFAARFFAKNGIKMGAANIRKLQPKAIPVSIGAHEIDAASTWEPFVNSALKAMGGNGVVFRDPEAHRGYMHLAVRQGWAQKNRGQVVEFLKALKEAEEFISGNPNEAQAILAQKMGLDLPTVKSIWNYYNIRLTFDRPRLVDATTAVGTWIKQSQESYATKPLPDYGRYYDDSYFQDVR